MISKRRLSSLLKQAHGNVWSRELAPIYDERGYASISLYRFDPEIAAEIAGYQPVNWIELILEKENDLASVQKTIAILLRGWKNYLEYVEIDYVTDVTAANDKKLWRALSKCEDTLADLPNLDELVVCNLDFSDDHLEAVCKNSRLTTLDIRNATITKRALAIVQRCPSLQKVMVTNCRHLSPNSQNELLKRLPKAKIAQIK